MSTANEGKDGTTPEPGELAKGLAPVRDATGLPPAQGEELKARVINVGLPKMPRPPQTLALEIAARQHALRDERLLERHHPRCRHLLLRKRWSE